MLQKTALDKLLVVETDKKLTDLIWLRQAPCLANPRNFLKVVERLEFIRHLNRIKLGNKNKKLETTLKRIVEFPLENGDSILVEVDEPTITDDRIGIRDEVVQKATQTFESALDKIKPVANVILTKVRNLNQPADEVQVKFGIKISAELGAVVASGSAEVNYEITLKWKQESQNEGSA